jgi:RNA polymerase-binding transcription factor DksA
MAAKKSAAKKSAAKPAAKAAAKAAAKPAAKPAPKKSAKPTPAAAHAPRRGRPPGATNKPKVAAKKEEPKKLITKTDKASATKPVEKSTVRAKPSKTASTPVAVPKKPAVTEQEIPNLGKLKTTLPAAFLKAQKARLLELKDGLINSLSGMTEDTLRAPASEGGGSAFGMHQADAGSDAYDRDFALSLLSQEQDALYEIDEALKRIERNTYGMCEMSGKEIPQLRLEARPYTRFTVECQEKVDKEYPRGGGRFAVKSLFGLGDDDDEDEDDDNESLENEKD